MIHLTVDSPIMLAIKPVDFRKQIDGLIHLCQQSLNMDPRSGTLFVFINRARTMIRILHYDHNGYWLATKRLSKDRYTHWPKHSEITCQANAIKLREILKNVLASKEL